MEDKGDSETLQLDEWLPYAFSVVANNISDILARYYTERFDLKPSGWRVLATLGEKSPLSAKELGERIAADAVTVSRAISELSELGFVSRRADPGDRRRVVLRLSKKGAAAYAEIVPVARKVEQQLTKGLSDKDMAALRGVMRKLVEASKHLARAEPED